MANTPTENTNNTHQNPAPAYAEDEISLIDLVSILVRRKKTLYWVFSLIVLLGVTAAFVLPKKYTYSTSIEIGQRVVKGEVKLIDEPETLLAKINKSYIPLALQTYYKTNSDDEKIYNIEANIPKKSQIIFLSIKGTEEEENALEFLSIEVVKNVVSDHARLINIIKKNYELQFETIENEIQSVEQQALIYKADLQRLEKNTELVIKQVKNITVLVNDGIKNRSKASRNVSSESNAMTLLMIDNEIQQNRNKLDRLEEKLIVDLTNKKDVLNKKLSDTTRLISNKKGTLALKKLQLENLQDTRSLGIAMKSLEPVSLSKKLILVLFIFIGLLISILVAFIHEFVVKLNKKLA